MTPDPASQAVHERLEAAVAAMPTFDVEAGWSAFVADLEPPLATVIPLRRRRPHRAIVLGVAAALVIGGSAFAAVRHGDASPLSVVAPVTGQGSGLVIGPHVHGAFSGAPSTPNGGSDPNPAGDGGSGAEDRQGTGDTTGETGGTSGGTDGTGSSTGAWNADSPDDIDHGSGNDGQHDDNGGGNDTQGQDPGQGSGGGDSSGGSGDGDSNAQGSNDQGGEGNGQ